MKDKKVLGYVKVMKDTLLYYPFLIAKNTKCNDHIKSINKHQFPYRNVDQYTIKAYFDAKNQNLAPLFAPPLLCNGDVTGRSKLYFIDWIEIFFKNN